MNTSTDTATGQVTRTINDGVHVITQVSQPDGSWWNIRVERAV